MIDKRSYLLGKAIANFGDAGYDPMTCADLLMVYCEAANMTPPTPEEVKELIEFERYLLSTGLLVKR